MYSYEDRIRAVELYMKLGKCIRPTVRQLGCLSPRIENGVQFPRHTRAE